MDGKMIHEGFWLCISIATINQQWSMTLGTSNVCFP